jgi:heme exporter protein D
MMLFVRLPGPFAVGMGGSGKRKGGGFAEFVWWMLVVAVLLMALVVVCAIFLIAWLIEAVRWLANRRLRKRGLSPIPRARAVQCWFNLFNKQK